MIRKIVLMFCLFNISFAEEILSTMEVLKPSGDLGVTGWAKNPIFVYNPQFIPENLKPQKKEWEHYTTVGKEFALSLTLVNLGFAVAALVDFSNYDKNIYYSNFFTSLDNFHKFPLTLTPYGNANWEKDGEFISFSYKDGVRYLDFYFKNKIVIAPLRGTLKLIQPKETIAVVRPFSEPGLFFYENKVFGMPSSGRIKVNGVALDFKEQETFSILDWGRGVWPKSGSWKWGFASGIYQKKQISLNMSYGYGDDSAGTVNALLVNGEIQKIDKIKWIFNPKNLMAPWRVISNDGKIKLTFYPKSFVPVDLDILVYFAKLKKFYGTFSGQIMLEDGEVIQVNNLLGFTENLLFKW